MKSSAAHYLSSLSGLLLHCGLQRKRCLSWLGSRVCVCVCVRASRARGCFRIFTRADLSGAGPWCVLLACYQQIPAKICLLVNLFICWEAPAVESQLSIITGGESWAEGRGFRSSYVIVLVHFMCGFCETWGFVATLLKRFTNLKSCLVLKVPSVLKMWSGHYCRVRLVKSAGFYYFIMIAVAINSFPSSAV